MIFHGAKALFSNSRDCLSWTSGRQRCLCPLRRTGRKVPGVEGSCTRFFDAAGRSPEGLRWRGHHLSVRRSERVLDGGRIVSWLRTDANGQVTFDPQQVRAFVKELADKYDTAYTPRTFHTSGGQDITISEGDYGWRIDQEKETAHLLDLLAQKQSTVCEPVYAQTAAVHGHQDWGTTYIEVSLKDQQLWLYKDGQCLLQSYLVSGNPTRKHGTPKGIYGLTYKTRNDTLSGQGYDSKVKYWMPFNCNVGLHDAPWRSSFGGQIYKSNGSHGCLNLPPANAAKIYKNVDKNTPVIIY